MVAQLEIMQLHECSQSRRDYQRSRNTRTKTSTILFTMSRHSAGGQVVWRIQQQSRAHTACMHGVQFTTIFTRRFEGPSPSPTCTPLLMRLQTTAHQRGSRHDPNDPCSRTPHACGAKLSVWYRRATASDCWRLLATLTLWRLLLPHGYTAIKHPVPDRVKSSFVIFDIRALWRST